MEKKVARQKTVRLQINPETHVRATQGDKVCFRIPIEELMAKYPNLYKRRLRLEKYNMYKERLIETAFDAGFYLPNTYFHVTFYIPVSRTWKKWMKEKNHYQPHQQKPDADNLFKAFTDALLKQDQVIWDFRVTKVWTNTENGWIEIKYTPEDAQQANTAAK